MFRFGKSDLPQTNRQRQTTKEQDRSCELEHQAASLDQFRPCAFPLDQAKFSPDRRDRCDDAFHVRPEPADCGGLAPLQVKPVDALDLVQKPAVPNPHPGDTVTSLGQIAQGDGGRNSAEAEEKEQRQGGS